MFKFRIITIFISLILINACTTIEGPLDDSDPYESYNRSMDNFNVGFDNYILRPVAESYKEYIPYPVQSGVNNFFSNIDEVPTMINDLLQFKFTQLFEDFSRFVFNSTIGIFGIFDVATSFGLPKHQEDFGQTLATWGYMDSAYFIIPIFGLGGGTLRDSFGFTIDSLYFNPVLNIDDTTLLWTSVIVKNIDVRANLLNASKLLEQTALDPYIYKREFYLTKRKSLIYDGNPPISKLDLPDDDLDFDLELELELELQKQNQK